MDLVELYCSVDDFWKVFKPKWEKYLIDNDKIKRGPKPKLTVSEMLTIVILFHQSDYRTFKHFYNDYVSKFLKKEFPDLISYSRFVYLMKNLFIPLLAYLHCKKGKVSGISFVDSTPIIVCHKKRISRNKTFKGITKIRKTTKGWFYGFKLHLIINDMGEILSFKLTQGNVSDISVLEKLSNGIVGKLFGDKGYISSKVSHSLLKRGLQLVTTIKKNMKQKFLLLKDKILLRKRSLIETVNDQLKNISQIEHTRHRSSSNFLVNLLAGLAAYVNKKKKPHLKFQDSQINELIVA